MKQPLKEWRGPAPTFTTNTLYNSVGEVTLTMSAELAAFIYGVMGRLPSNVTMPGGEKLNIYSSFYTPLGYALENKGLTKIQRLGSTTK